MSGDLRDRTAEYVVVQFAAPGSEPVNIGVLLLDPDADRLYLKFRGDWASIANEQDVHVLSELADDFRQKALELGGVQLLKWCEDTLSNAVRITERRRVQVRDFSSALSEVFADAIGRSAGEAPLL